MAVGSNVNPNYPIPGLDQSSKGFRDNFATIKKEIEDLQGTTIQLAGGVVSDPYTLGDGSMVIQTAIAGGAFYINPPDHAIQFNRGGALTGDSNLVFDDVLVRVGIGSSKPTCTLDVGGAIASKDLSVAEPTAGSGANVRMHTATTSAGWDLRANKFSAYANGNIPYEIRTSGGTMILEADGSVGIGTSAATHRLQVHSSHEDIARFEGNIAISDSMIRATAHDATSSIGWGLEHAPGNWVGGMRLDNLGRLTLHTGETSGAQLSTSTSRIVIDAAGKVGIGVLAPNYVLEIDGGLKTLAITDASLGADRLVGINRDDPMYTLDVYGDVATAGAFVSTVSPLVVDTDPLVIDAWPMSEIRAARYTITVTRGTPPTESVDVIEYMAAEANGNVFDHTFATISTGPALGDVTALVNSDFIEVYYTGFGMGNTVTLAKTYVRK